MYSRLLWDAFRTLLLTFPDMSPADTSVAKLPTLMVGRLRLLGGRGQPVRPGGLGKRRGSHAGTGCLALPWRRLGGSCLALLDGRDVSGVQRGVQRRVKQ